MNASHRRPLFAYVLVTVAGAVVVAQGVFVGAIPIPFFGLDLERGQQVAGGQLIEQRESIPRTEAEGDRSPLEDLVIDDETFEDLSRGGTSSSSDVAPDAPVSAAPQPEAGGVIRSGLVGGGSPGSGPGDGGQGDGSGGGSGDDPVFGGPDATPGDGGPDDGGAGPGPDEGPKPHDFDSPGNSGNGSHPYGPAQPPRGPGNNNGHGHGADKDKPAKPPKDKPAKPPKDKPAKPPKDKPAKPPKDKPAKPPKDKNGHAAGHDKPAKDKPGKGLAKGKGKVKPGSKGKKNS